MRRLLLALVLSLITPIGAPAASPSGPPSAAEVSVSAIWRGFETRCAEMDNVVIALRAQDVRRFVIEARHPGYLAGLSADILAPDFTGCVFPKETIHQFEPFALTLYEDDRLMLVGWRFRLSWRPDAGVFVVGDRRFPGLHLTQLFVKTDRGPVEVLVLYPSDGYWRARPLPALGWDVTGYGASFVLGPIDDSEHRPFVRIAEVAFDPATLTYALAFREGGAATVRLSSLSPQSIALDVTLDLPEGEDTVAIYSSMHVAPDNADVSRLAFRPVGEALWRTLPIDGFSRVDGADFAFGRDIPSRHNASAPDMIFRDFSAE